VEVQQKKQSASFFRKYSNLSQNNQDEVAAKGEPSSDAEDSVSDNSSSTEDDDSSILDYAPFDPGPCST
jgi:hypothetical protein